MTVRTKLLATILIPLLVMTALAAVVVRNSWQVASDMHEIQRLTEYAATVSSLIHETQKERGATAGYLGSKSDEFLNRLQEQRKKTDSRLQGFRTLLTNFDPTEFGARFAESVQSGLQELEQLPAKREAILSGDLPAAQAIGYYTKMNGLFLDSVGCSALATSDGEIAVQMSAYTSFLKSKERAGVERAVLSNAFAKDAFGPGMYEKFTVLVATQDTFLSEFLNVTSAESKQYYQETMASPVVSQVDAFRQVAKQKAGAGGFGQDAGEWFDTITKKINLLKQVDDHLAQSLQSDAGAKASRARAVQGLVAVLSGAAFCLVAVGGWLAVRSVLKRIASVTERIQDIASGEGDLTQRLEVNNDELGKMSSWFNTLLDKIEEMVISIASTSRDLATSSEQLRNTAGNLIEGANQSKVQSSSISAATEQMSSTMTQTAAATEQMATGIASISESVESIQSAIANIEEHSSRSAQITQTAAQRVEGGNAQVSQLGNAAQEIGNVMDVIQDIAEQTNLLALNATIEAARAGEAGKGFAVVATEVKELARQTAEATDGIRERVTSMQDCTSETMTAMSDIDAVIRDIAEVASTIAESVSQQSQGVAAIASNMQQSTEATRSMSIGVNESAQATKEITRNVTGVDSQLSAAVEAASQTGASGEQVAELARSLEEQVGRFKTSR